jgi:hypothetical protein
MHAVHLAAGGKQLTEHFGASVALLLAVPAPFWDYSAPAVALT